MPTTKTNETDFEEGRINDICQETAVGKQWLYNIQPHYDNECILCRYIMTMSVYYTVVYYDSEYIIYSCTMSWNVQYVLSIQ
jgi:hypothetical protein